MVSLRWEFQEVFGALSQREQRLTPTIEDVFKGFSEFFGSGIRQVNSWRSAPSDRRGTRIPEPGRGRTWAGTER